MFTAKFSAIKLYGFKKKCLCFIAVKVRKDWAICQQSHGETTVRGCTQVNHYVTKSGKPCFLFYFYQLSTYFNSLKIMSRELCCDKEKKKM